MSLASSERGRSRSQPPGRLLLDSAVTSWPRLVAAAAAGWACAPAGGCHERPPAVAPVLRAAPLCFPARLPARSRHQFVQALYLIDCAKRGMPIPAALPPGPFPPVAGTVSIGSMQVRPGAAVTLPQRWRPYRA